MGEYDRYEDEDLDEYEEDDYEQVEEDAGEDEDEYEEEEDPRPTKEVLDYLELRQRLKEEKRKKLKKESGTVNGSSREKNNVIPKDSYGSFFGPSQPVIAQRVIQESKSLLENPNLAAKVIKSSQTSNRSSSSVLSVSKSQASAQRPKVANGLQKKVEMIKNTRDYSFLLSDDAELPAPKKVPPPRNVSAPKPEARSAQVSERSKDFLSSNGRKVSSSREDKKPTVSVNRMQPKVGADRLASGGKQVQTSVDSRKHLVASNGTLSHHRKQLSSSTSSGPGRPVVSKGVPSKVLVGGAEKKVAVPVAKTSAPAMHKPSSSKLHAPVSKQSFPRKEEYQASGKPKVLPKQPVPPPKPKQVMQPPPKTSTRDTSRDERPRKRPMRRDNDEDPEQAISMIRKMFGYNPKRYQDADDDCAMETGFDDIMREEKRSARIAKKEDDEELLKMEEEERRERLRKDARKRKLSHR
ncbi:hypothetical protein ACH5RR_011599 [Cinchona calisaya]|uniref:Protein SPT2 homolog n=1 Tax=Cinchona calisaya TaxID=153742 RepID=A0ABD3A6X2_9GENT